MYELKVKGMTCGSCARAMQSAVKTIDPNVEISINLRSQTVQIKSDRDQAEITALIEDVGYPVLEVRKI